MVVVSYVLCELLCLSGTVGTVLTLKLCIFLMLEFVVINQLNDIFIVYIADTTIWGIFFNVILFFFLHEFGNRFMKSEFCNVLF